MRLGKKGHFISQEGIKFYKISEMMEFFRMISHKSTFKWEVVKRVHF